MTLRKDEILAVLKGFAYLVSVTSITPETLLIGIATAFQCGGELSGYMQKLSQPAYFVLENEEIQNGKGS